MPLHPAAQPQGVWWLCTCAQPGGVGWDTCSPQTTVVTLFPKGAGERVELPPARAQPPPAGDWKVSAGHPSHMASGLIYANVCKKSLSSMSKTRGKELLVQVGITGKEEPDSFQRCAVKI